MKYHIHIPKLLEFALYVVCDDVTLRGKNCLITPIPYPLYLRCITTYADKYDTDRYSLFRFYRDIVYGFRVDVKTCGLYPNMLDHVVLDDDVDAESLFKIIAAVSESQLVDDAAASIQRFASRCLAADKSEMMENAMSQVLKADYTFPQPIIDVLLFYGAKLDPNDDDYFNQACRLGMNDDIIRCIADGHVVVESDLIKAAESGNNDTIILVFSSYRGEHTFGNVEMQLPNATVQSLELLLSLNILQRGTHCKFYNIPSLSVLQWILDHDLHDHMISYIAAIAVQYSGVYFEMLKYAMEQRSITPPYHILTASENVTMCDLDVFDYLLLHGADVNAVLCGQNVLERFPMLIRYWIDKGFVVQSDDVNSLIECIQSGMTAPVLEMMIDKYELNVNAFERNGYTALHLACRWNKYEVVEMLIARGADVFKKNFRGETAISLTSNNYDSISIRQLIFNHKTIIPSNTIV